MRDTSTRLRPRPMDGDRCRGCVGATRRRAPRRRRPHRSHNPHQQAWSRPPSPPVEHERSREPANSGGARRREQRRHACPDRRARRLRLTGSAVRRRSMKGRAVRATPREMSDPRGAALRVPGASRRTGRREYALCYGQTAGFICSLLIEGFILRRSCPSARQTCDLLSSCGASWAGD